MAMNVHTMGLELHTVNVHDFKVITTIFADVFEVQHIDAKHQENSYQFYLKNSTKKPFCFVETQQDYTGRFLSN